MPLYQPPASGTGAAGTAGSGGAGIDGEDGQDSFIPGPPGIAGAAGAAGAPGSQTLAILGFDGEDGDTTYAQGPTGPQGATGSVAVATDTIWDAKGDLAAATAADTAAKLTVGANGFVLTADSAETTGLKWVAAGGGALVLLEQHPASASATLDFTAFISATYDDYQFELVDVLPATNAVQLLMRCSVAATFDASSLYGTGAWTYVSGGSTTFGSTTTSITTSNANDTDNNAGRGVVGQVRLYNPGGSQAYKKLTYDIGWLTGGVPKHATAMGFYNNTSAVDGFRFLFSTGNITSGTIRVYGIAKT